MEAIGTLDAQGNTVLRKVPEQIRITHKGESMTLDRYTGPSYNTPQGQIQYGDYITFGLHLDVRWLATHPTEWERVR